MFYRWPHLNSKTLGNTWRRTFNSNFLKCSKRTIWGICKFFSYSSTKTNKRNGSAFRISYTHIYMPSLIQERMCGANLELFLYIITISRYTYCHKYYHQLWGRFIQSHRATAMIEGIIHFNIISRSTEAFEYSKYHSFSPTMQILVCISAINVIRVKPPYSNARHTEEKVEWSFILS